MFPELENRSGKDFSSQSTAFVTHSQQTIAIPAKKVASTPPVRTVRTVQIKISEQNGMRKTLVSGESREVSEKNQLLTGSVQQKTSAIERICFPNRPKMVFGCRERVR